ncbi:MAG TPA: sigma-70 family RNA polymerase sigma factor [Phycisphaerales bacterium]|nr:sigma-70 family RNA polymerase sigma factor [Phycisphaerales bacterium]
MSQDPTQELADLLQAASRGDPAAWRELVARYSRRVYALAKSRCRNDDVAEEIAQSVFATVAAKVGGGEYTEVGRFESWLFRVAMNRVRDTVRKARRRPESHDPEVLANQPGRREEAPAFDAGAVSRLRLAMEDLSEADREIIELRHHGGLSFKQMSEVLEEPVGTLLARHHRALKKLRDALEASEQKSAAEVDDE